MMRTPDNKGVVDAEFYSEACFKKPQSDLEHYIMSFANKEYKARARVSPRKSRIYYMPTTYPEFMRSIIYSFHLREDDTAWKKVVRLCEETGYGHPNKLKKNAVHIPDWNTYGLPFDQDGKTTLQECVDSSETGNEVETRDPSDDLVRGS